MIYIRYKALQLGRAVTHQKAGIGASGSLIAQFMTQRVGRPDEFQKAWMCDLQHDRCENARKRMGHHEEHREAYFFLCCCLCARKLFRDCYGGAHDLPTVTNIGAWLTLDASIEPASRVYIVSVVSDRTVTTPGKCSWYRTIVKASS